MSQQRFFEMLNRQPRIEKRWDQQNSSLKIEAFEQALGVMSSGEVQMAKFFASVWFHNNKAYGFDLAGCGVLSGYRWQKANYGMDSQTILAITAP